MNVLIENEYESESIGYAENLYEATGIILKDLANKYIDIDKLNLYGFPKYYQRDLDIVVDYGLLNFKYTIESVFSGVL